MVRAPRGLLDPSRPCSPIKTPPRVLALEVVEVAYETALSPFGPAARRGCQPELPGSASMIYAETAPRARIARHPNASGIANVAFLLGVPRGIDFHRVERYSTPSSASDNPDNRDEQENDRPQDEQTGKFRRLQRRPVNH